MKKWITGLVVLVLLVAGIAFLGYQQGWIAPPELVVELTATAPDGGPLPGVVVEALGEARGETDNDGKLVFSFHRGVGEEFTVSAKLEQPGFEFAPWEQGVVVRKWDRKDPETLRYPLEAVLEPVAISAAIRVDAEGSPAAGASVSLDGKSLGKTDENGMLAVDLGDQVSRSGKVAVSLKGYKRWRDMVDLRGNATVDVSLSKIGIIYGSLRATYESMGRLVPVPGAQVVLGGKSLGKTDEKGSLRIALPSRSTSAEVTKEGFLPEPAVATVSKRTKAVNVTLYPEDAPVYRLVVLPSINGKPGDRDVESALTEVEDMLSDYLFSYACFRRVDSRVFLDGAEAAGLSEEKLLAEGWDKTAIAGLADAVVSTEVTNDNRLYVSVQVVSANGERLGAFVESDKRSKVRSISENASKKIVEIFPFEGHVLGMNESNIVASLGSGQDRGLKKGNSVTFYKLGSVSPPTLTPIGKGKIKSIKAEGSMVEPVGNIADLALGDKIVVAPRNREAAFNASLALTVMAGRKGSEQPFPDVNVYRDGTWVGITSQNGELDVPVASGDKHEFLFVKTGIAPHSEDIKAKGRRAQQVVILPNAMARLRLESEPAGAQVTLDGKLLGITPLDTDVPMGFRRIRLDAGEEWRVFDKVLEITRIEEDYTGARRLVLERDVLVHAEKLLADGDVQGAIGVLSAVPSTHSDFSAAHNRLGGIYLDVTKEPAKAVAEFEKVLSRPENKQLVNKRFTVTFLNLGRAYYLTGTPEGSEKAIAPLLTARDNKRFFPRDEYERASHDTLYFLALASHKLYYAKPSDKLLNETARRWRDYFDFFPDELKSDADVQQARAGAEHYYKEIQRKLGEGQ
jgi:hypothetical protein